MQKIKTDKILSQLGNLNDEQFKVLFFIYNTINLNSDNTNMVKIYRAVLADLTGKSERTISRITDKLAEQGLIIKDNVSDGSNLYNYYGFPKTKNEEKVDNKLLKNKENLVTDDRVKVHKSTKKDFKVPQSTLKSNIYNDIYNEKKEMTSIENKTLTMESFQKKVEPLLECKTEEDLIYKRIDLYQYLEKNRVAIGDNLYKRCMCYLNRKYEEQCELVQSETSTLDDLSFLE